MHRPFAAALALTFVLLLPACPSGMPCVALDCANGATCDDSGKDAVCVCPAGYAGPLCEACADGYQALGADGACLPGCEVAGLDCGAHGTCSDETGAARCACTLGWGGDACATCEPGYEYSGAGCEPAGDGLGCATARFLDPRAHRITGTNADALNGASGTCLAETGAERVYVFASERTMQVRFEADGYDTALYVRRNCEDPASEPLCDEGGPGIGSVVEGMLAEGTYYLFVDARPGASGTFTLDYDIRTDPCASDPCPGQPHCEASDDWRTYTCACPEGLAADGEQCVPDPCTADPCVEGPAHRTVCTPTFPGHTCACEPGWLDDGEGGCARDPDAHQWTVMVYLNADNDLERYGYADLEEMALVGSSPYVHLVVLFDSYEQDGGGARTLYVTEGGHEVLEGHGEIDMGDWRTLRDFGVWAIEQFPARRYALLLWDHGDGWRLAPSPTEAPLKGFSNDLHGSRWGISISSGDYARALDAIAEAAGDRLDLVGFDACLMGMYEVAHATAPYARYLVASPETEPATGWRWNSFLERLLADPSLTPEKLGVAMVDGYYRDDILNKTLAVTDLDALGEVDVALSGLADALMASPELYDDFERIRRESQSFHERAHRDLQDFAERIAALPEAPKALRTAAENLVSALETAVVLHRSQDDYLDAHGLAIYLPSRYMALDPAYMDEGATWSHHTRWDEFLEDFRLP